MGSGDIVVGKPLKSRQSSVKDPAVLSVTVWLADHETGCIVMGGSTAQSPERDAGGSIDATGITSHAMAEGLADRVRRSTSRE